MTSSSTKLQPEATKHLNSAMTSQERSDTDIIDVMTSHQQSALNDIDDVTDTKQEPATVMTSQVNPLLHKLPLF